MSVSEKKAEDAIYLYGLPEASGQDALGAGVIPQDVLTDAIEKAAQAGVILDVGEQSAILRDAERILSSVKPATKTETPPIQAQTQGFFSRLWGGGAF